MPDPNPRELSHDAIALNHLTLSLAHQAVVADIQTNAHRVAMPHGDGLATWWDTRPMLDPREQPPQAIDMAQQALSWADAMGVTTRHPEHAHLVRITTFDTQDA